MGHPSKLTPEVQVGETDLAELVPELAEARADFFDFDDDENERLLAVVRRAAEAGDQEAVAWLRGEGYMRATDRNGVQFVRFDGQSGGTRPRRSPGRRLCSSATATAAGTVMPSATCRRTTSRAGPSARRGTSTWTMV